MSSKSVNTFDFKLFKRLLWYTKPYRIIFLTVGCSVILLSLFGVLRPFFLQQAIDQGIIPKSNIKLQYFVGLIFLVLLTEVIFQFVFSYFANWLGQKVIRDIRVQLFAHILNFRKRYFDHAAIGRLVTRAVGDIETISSIFSQGLFMIISDLLKMTVVLAYMFYQSWKLSFFVLLILPLILIATKIFQKKMKAAFDQVRTQVANLNSFVQERITGMKIVQLFTREAIAFDNFKAINAKHRNAWIKTVWYNSIFFPLAEIASSITIGLIVWFGGLWVVQDQMVSLGMVVAFVEMCQLFFKPLRQIADKFNTLQMGMVAANRVFGILDKKDIIPDLGKITLQQVKGDITFRNVRFGYKEGEEVLKGISFSIKAGETIAIVGSTGAGKSTLIHLLCRLYEIQSGEIQLDGQNISNISLQSLRSHIALVLQDVFLFADSIYNNIALHNPKITEEQVKIAAKEIGIHEFISSLPNGYRYAVKERGAMLSSGQRQFIAFLRAYITNPSILILDEATSSIDTYTEEAIQKAIRKITKNRTAIIIAHRLATIKEADTILVMDQGRVVEHGNHQDLLDKPNGFYKKLHQASDASFGIANQ